MNDAGEHKIEPVTTKRGSAPIRVLLCEDNRGDYVLLAQQLRLVGTPVFEIDWVRTLDDSFAALRRNAHDVALVDYRLIGGSGLDVLREAIAIGWPAPVIMLTSLHDPSIDLNAMKIGACDFLSKDDLRPSTLERSIRYGIEKKRAEAAATQTNRELLQYIVKLRDAKSEIELQNRRIVSLAHHLASTGHADGDTDAATGGSRFLAVEAEELGIWNFDVQGRTVDANSVTLALFELKNLGGLTALSFDVLLPEDSRRRLQDALNRLQPKAAITIEVELIGQVSGRHAWAVMSVLAAGSGTGQPVYYLATVVDVTMRRNAENATRYLARHDSLTGLANRAWFRERLDFATAIARRNKTLVGLLCVDLDGFKEVNDSLGHQAGDRLLKDIAERLCTIVRESDLVARLGGDEFGVAATNLHSYQDVTAVAHKVTAALETPFEIRERIVNCGASVGVAVFPTDSEDFEELFELADTAMYRRKRGRSRADRKS